MLRNFEHTCCFAQIAKVLDRIPGTVGTIQPLQITNSDENLFLRINKLARENRHMIHKQQSRKQRNRNANINF